ncbi:hypothetical protein RB195_020131 [Necator americanus]|uniref:Uncharacterized protein n=1 Tax=Necator americanus TaxID=51031 RepID=A0ABR1CHD5_NECAM
METIRLLSLEEKIGLTLPQFLRQYHDIGARTWYRGVNAKRNASLRGTSPYFGLDFASHITTGIYQWQNHLILRTFFVGWMGRLIG